MYLNCEDYLNENCQKYKTNENDLHNVKPTSNLRTFLYGTIQECCHSLERTQEDIFRYHFRFPPEPQTLVQLLIGSFRSYPSLNSERFRNKLQHCIVGNFLHSIWRRVFQLLLQCRKWQITHSSPPCISALSSNNHHMEFR